MSARRSGRAKAPVKYTSDSEGSDFGNKKPRKTKATPKKRAKVEEEDEPTAAPSPTKRAKKDADTPAAQDKAFKSQQKSTWDSFLKAHDIDGALLADEPAREDSITQTDSIKKYALKKEDLTVLKHFEKKNPNPVFKNTIKLYIEDEVRELGFRKLGVLDGSKDGDEAVKRGEQIWAEEHKDDDEATEEKKDAKPKKASSKPKTHKQTWTAYIEAHTVSAPDSLEAEPEESINQSDCKAKYSLLPGDLAILPYFPKPNQKYGNTTKLFSESEIKALAYRKAAVLGGVEEGDEVELLEKGRELFEERK